MDPFLKMNVFFVVTTFVVVALGAVLVVILVYVARLVRTLDKIASEVEEETVQLRGDIADVRAKAKKEGLKLSQLLSFFGLRTRAKRRTTK